MNTKELFWNLWQNLLDDDDGISEEAYSSLCSLAENIDPERFSEEVRFVDATDGRFYISAMDDD